MISWLCEGDKSRLEDGCAQQVGGFWRGCWRNKRWRCSLCGRSAGCSKVEPGGPAEGGGRGEGT